MEYVKLLLMFLAVIQVIIAAWHGGRGRKDKDMHYSVQAILTFSVLILIEVTQ